MRALGFYELGGETRLLGVVTNDLGLLSRANGDDAVRWFQYAVDARRDAGDLKGLRPSLGNLGSSMLVRGHWREAMPVLEEALALAEANDDLEGQRKAHTNLAGAWLLAADDSAAPAWSPDAGSGPRATAFNHLRQAQVVGAKQGLDAYRSACEGLLVDAKTMCAQLTGVQPPRAAGSDEEDEQRLKREP